MLITQVKWWCTAGTAMARDNYNYTVCSLLREAGEHRRSYHPCGPKCLCEDDHVIELRMVVKALNQLRNPTYTHDEWQKTLVRFFNAKHKNWECLPHNEHLEKTRAVNKWLRDPRQRLSHQEMMWINEIRDVWKKNREQLKGFEKFKQELTSTVLRMS